MNLSLGLMLGSSALGGAGTPAYAGHNMVVFNQDYLTNSAGIGLGSEAGFFFAAKFNMPALPAGNWYLWNTGRGTAGAVAGTNVYITASGEIVVYILNVGAAAAPYIAAGTVGLGLDVDTDYTIHASIDSSELTGGTSELITPSSASFTATFLITDISSRYHSVTRNDLAQTEGVHYTVTQTNPAILDFTISGDDFDGVETVAITIHSNWIKLWVNGTRVPVVALAADQGSTTWDMTAANASRAVIGNRHAVVGTPTYTTTEYLGYVDGGAGDVGVEVGFILFNDAPNADPTTTSTNGTDIDLSAFASAGATPAKVFFGGQQTAANWNAGTNQGTGGDFTMTGDVTV